MGGASPGRKTPVTFLTRSSRDSPRGLLGAYSGAALEPVCTWTWPCECENMHTTVCQAAVLWVPRWDGVCDVCLLGGVWSMCAGVRCVCAVCTAVSHAGGWRREGCVPRVGADECQSVCVCAPGGAAGEGSWAASLSSLDRALEKI